MKSYWIAYPREFGNEYEVGISTSSESARDYAERGFMRIRRDEACRSINRPGDDATQIYCGISVDGEQYFGSAIGARAILHSIQ